MRNRIGVTFIVLFLMLAGFVGFFRFGSLNAKGTNVSGIQFNGSGGPWTLAKSPYIVVDNVTVPAGQTLTIEPGVKVKFDGFYNLNIDGNLIAIGDRSTRIDITSNKVEPAKNDWNRISIASTGHIEIKYANISYGFLGIYLESSTNIIVNNTISNNIYGLYLYISNQNKIINNTISNNSIGLYGYYSSYNKLVNNTIFSSEGQGIYFYWFSYGNIIANNSIHSNIGSGLHLYWESKYNFIENNTFSKNERGIYISKSGGNQIINNKIYSNVGIGIHLYWGSYSTIIVNNTIYSNGGSGIYFEWGTNGNLIINNTIINNERGVLLKWNVYNNLVAGNMISNNGYGIVIQWQWGENIIKYNTISNNIYGALLGGIQQLPYGNRIFRNNFLYNTFQAIDETASGNYWNYDYPIGGNYWSDYSPNCYDDYNGSVTPQITGSPDGICDIQYDIDLDSIDYYPLADLVPVGTGPPTIATWEPGGTSGQTYIQGTTITVRWDAIDDYPLPVNPVNITYGNSTVGWTTIALDEANDGTYLWNTTGVPCPGTYWMNLSVYDSIGQTDFDESNYSFNILCPDLPPSIEVLEPGGSLGQTYIQGANITVRWNAYDTNPLPANPINITYGNSSVGWTKVALNESNDGTYFWNTKSVPCPGIYIMNLSVYDSIGQTTFDESNYSFDILCPIDNPPAIEAWEPGGNAGQTYTQGDLIKVTWNVVDDNILPANPINITYGDPISGWKVLSTDEPDDGTYTWDTSAVLCPGTYWMNLSVYDSIDQMAYDEGNYSFDIDCIVTYPPAIEDVKAEPDPQTVGKEVRISARITDLDTDNADLVVKINIIRPNGKVLGNFTMTYDPNVGKFTYTSSYDMEGVYTFVIWASDDDDNWVKDDSMFVMEPENKVDEYNWKPLVALIFSITLLLVGIMVSLKRPLKFKENHNRNELYTWMVVVLPFVIAESITGLVSLITGALSIPPLMEAGIIVDLVILITGLSVFWAVYRKGGRIRMIVGKET